MSRFRQDRVVDRHGQRLRLLDVAEHRQDHQEVEEVVERAELCPYHGLCAHDAEDRTRRPSSPGQGRERREHRLECHHRGGTAEKRNQVDADVPGAAHHNFGVAAQDVEGVHVDREVQDAEVQEPGADEPELLTVI